MLKNKRRYMLFLILSCLLGVFFLGDIADAYTNKQLHWGFKKSRNEEPPHAGAELDALLEKYDAVYLGNTEKKWVYLTFDNGYENGYTNTILDTLRDEGVPATFFITGHYLKDQPDLVKRMVNEGHIVGNHSYHHPDLTQVSDQKLKDELEKLDKAFYQFTGVKEMKYLRPPRGVFSERTLAITREMGYYNVFWSLAFIDWQTDKQKGWKYAYDNILQQIHPGAVILLHSVSSDNAEALPKVIQDLRQKGYEFKSLDHLYLEKQDIDTNLIPS